MADLESVLADVSYLMAMERSKAPGAKSVKKFALPDRSVHNVVLQYMKLFHMDTFEAVHTQRMGSHFMKKFLPPDDVQYSSLKAILSYERVASLELRRTKAKEIYDRYFFSEMLAMSHAFPKEMLDEISESISKYPPPSSLFDRVKAHIYTQLHDTHMTKFIKSEHFVRFCQWKYMELSLPQTICLNDFSVHRIIGRGGFGEVYGCRKDDSGKMFAMKLLDKKRIKLKKGEALALNEKNMLAKVNNSPFIVNLYYAFQTGDKLCFILDLINGGDLHYHLTQHGVFSEDEVRFYAAELILALEHIHAQNIVYRDLKPSNILLDEKGHIRLSDLGLACEFIHHQPSSSVGTHGYMAPEVIKKGVQYTFTSDWFSLGCVLYKLLRGHGPFRAQNAKNKDEIDKVTLEKDVVMPASMSDPMKQLLTGLLQKDPGSRLGCRGRSSEEVKGMAFFATTNWDDVMDKKLQPPLIPPRGEVNAADAFDIGNFDDDDTRGIRVAEDDQKLYRKFNLVVSDRWQAEMMESIFEAVNNEAEKKDSKDRRQRKMSSNYSPDVSFSDIVLQGCGYKLNSTAGIFSSWQKKYFILYPNRLEWADTLQSMAKAQVLTFDTSVLVDEKEHRGMHAIRLQQIGNKKEHCIRFDAQFETTLWVQHLKDVALKSQSMLHGGPKAMRDNSSMASITPQYQPGRQRRGIHVTNSLPILSQSKN